MRSLQLIALGKELFFHMTRARVPMPKSTRDYVERLQEYRERVSNVTRSQVAPQLLSSSWRTERQGSAWGGTIHDDALGCKTVSSCSANSC